jgi:hypothetical protein
MSVENLFIQAARKQFRFESVRGFVSAEDLWTMPLQAKSGFDLDNVAKATNAALANATDTSFVSTTTNPAKAELETKLEIVKFVIATKLQENQEALAAGAKKALREKLTNVLAEKQDAALKDMTPDELQAQITALS